MILLSAFALTGASVGGVFSLACSEAGGGGGGDGSLLVGAAL